jgi:hypothetical protein
LKRTVKEIGELLGITDPNEARGLVKFLVSKGVLVEEGVREPPGGKGRGATLYVVKPGTTTEKMAEILMPLF